MRSIKSMGKGLRMDLNQGFLKHIYLLLSPILVGLLTFADFYNRTARLVAEGRFAWADISCGECWLYVYGGMQRYLPGTGQQFQFPVTWIVLFLLGSFLVLNYPFKNLENVGQQVLVRMRGRTAWWLAKCLWNVISTLYYHGVVMLTLLALCGEAKLQINGRVDPMFVNIIFDIADWTDILDCSLIPAASFMLPVVMAMALNLCQLLLSLYIKPLNAFLVTAVYDMMSAYLFVPWLMGNYGMALRGGWLYQNGVNLRTGFLLAGVMTVAAVWIGQVKFKRYYDIL